MPGRRPVASPSMIFVDAGAPSSVIIPSRYYDVGIYGSEALDFRSRPVADLLPVRKRTLDVVRSGRHQPTARSHRNEQLEDRWRTISRSNRFGCVLTEQ